MSSVIEQQVREIVSGQLGVAEDEIRSDSNFGDDLGADSLDVVELVMELEDKFAIEITDEDAQKLTTFQQVVDYIAERKS